MRDVDHQIPFVLGPTVVSEIRKRIVYIIEITLVVFCQGLYNILCPVLSFWFLTGF